VNRSADDATDLSCDSHLLRVKVANFSWFISWLY